MATKLYVGNLSYDVTDESLNKLFAEIGPVVSASVITDKYNGRSKGFGFVEMENEEDAKAAIEKLHDQEFEGRKLNVAEAKPRVDRPAGGSRGGFGGGGGGRRF